MKIKGVSIWIWLAGIAVLGGAVIVAVPLMRAATRPPPLEVVMDALWASQVEAEVRGKIYNPRKTPARNVIVSYDLAVENVQSNTKKKVDPAVTEIRYVPAGATVDYIATSCYRMRKWDVVEKSQAEIHEGK